MKSILFVAVLFGVAMTSHAITIDVDQATYDKFQETCSNTAMEACESVGYCRVGEAGTKKP